jgi:hypothetical protein
MTIKTDFVDVDIITLAHKIVAIANIIVPPHNFAHPSH